MRALCLVLAVLGCAPRRPQPTITQQELRAYCEILAWRWQADTAKAARQKVVDEAARNGVKMYPDTGNGVVRPVGEPIRCEAI